MKKQINMLYAFLAVSILVGCGGLKPTLNPNYQSLKPKYVLVLPPENPSAAANVEEKVYPVIYAHMALQGYYCISPEVARGIFNAQKLEDAGRINSIPPQKLGEIFGVDAILKVNVFEWSSKYVVISSTVNVGLELELIKASDGQQLWYLKNLLSKAPGGNNNGIIGALVNAALHAAVTPYEPILEENSQSMFKTLPMGPYGKTSK